MTLFWTPRFQGPPIKKNATEVSLLGGGGPVFIIRGTGLHTYIHTYIHTHGVRTYIHTCITNIQTNKQTNIHTYIHTYGSSHFCSSNRFQAVGTTFVNGIGPTSNLRDFPREILDWGDRIQANFTCTLCTTPRLCQAAR